MATRLYVVTGDGYRIIDRRVREIKRQLDQDGGSPLDPHAVAEALQKIVDGDFIETMLPTEMTIAGRTYEILSFLRGDEKFVFGHPMVERAKEMQAHLGEDEGQHFLDHQEEIPEVLRGRVTFVFTDWRLHGNPENVACIYWDGHRWVEDWDYLGRRFHGRRRVLRRTNLPAVAKRRQGLSKSPSAPL